jgi:hypothetical protein
MEFVIANIVYRLVYLCVSLNSIYASKILYFKAFLFIEFVFFDFTNTLSVNESINACAASGAKKVLESSSIC